MPYTNEEAFDMLMILGESFQNYRAAERLYAERYPGRQHQGYKSFERLAARVKSTGTVQPSEKRNKIPEVRVERSADIIAAVNMDPQISLRRLSRDSGIGKTSVFRILHTEKLHPYHISLHQSLEEDDHLFRINFAVWAQNKIQNHLNFYFNILWCDEATFKSNGEVNRHNMHYWSVENPHWMREINFQRQWSLNTWCGIFDGRIIGPYFFDENLTGEVYANFLNNEFLQLIQNIPPQQQQEMWFMQDGCPAHYAINVRTTLTAMFGEKWIGRGGPVPWPARSPDLTVMDYYLWARIKDIVYQTAPTTRDNMKERIRSACEQISREEIRKALHNFPRRLEKCLEADGRHFEHLM